MTPLEQEYYHELCSRLTDEFDPIFISFEEKELENPDNLVTQLHSSEYPLVLCAFLESAKYEADDTFVPFGEATPPSMEDVEGLLKDYNGNMPNCLIVFSHAKSMGFWQGIQYSRFFVNDQIFKHMSYAIAFSGDSKFIHGKGEIPVNHFGEIRFDKIIVID